MPKTKYTKRADGRYLKQIQIGYQDNGKPKLKNIYAKTVQELENKVAEFKSQMAKGIIVDDKKYTLGQWSLKWLKVYKAGVSYNTYTQYESCINRHIAKMPIANVKLARITPADLQEAMNSLIEKGLTRTVEIFVLTMHQIFDAAIDNDLIYKDPSKNLRAPKFQKEPRRALTAEEKHAIKTADYTPQQRAYLLLAWQAGLRRGEILALTKSNINFNEGVIHVKNNLIFKKNQSEINPYPKTGAGIRDIPMPKTLAAYLKEYTKTCGEYLFATQTGKIATQSMFRRMFQSIRTKTANYMESGEPPTFTTHILRHTYATTLYYAGVDVKTAQYLMGHESIVVTLAIYTHLDKLEASKNAPISKAFA